MIKIRHEIVCDDFAGVQQPSNPVVTFLIDINLDCLHFESNIVLLEPKVIHYYYGLRISTAYHFKAFFGCPARHLKIYKSHPFRCPAVKPLNGIKFCSL